MSLGGRVFNLAQAPGSRYKSTIRTSQLATGIQSPWTHPCLTTDSRAHSGRSRTEPGSMLSPQSSRACPRGNQNFLSCPNNIWGSFSSTQMTSLFGPHLNCQGKAFRHPSLPQALFGNASSIEPRAENAEQTTGAQHTKRFHAQLCSVLPQAGVSRYKYHCP